MGATPISGDTRHKYTPGAVLLGDAAGYADPVTGTGMTQALITAERLTKHLARLQKGDALVCGHSNNNVAPFLPSIGAWRTLLCGSPKKIIWPDHSRAQQISGLPAA
jgi:hypothetical protein